MSTPTLKSIHVMLFNRSSQKKVIEADVHRWLQIANPEQSNGSMLENFTYLIHTYPEFRTLFYYRLGTYTKFWSKSLLALAKALYMPKDTLYIYTPSIGPGLFIQHGFSTIISAAKMGENCWINQQVTIGYKDSTGCPTIGNNVHICAGAKVLGDITIGDNVVIGANAVVVKDVPANCVVAGIPGQIIKQTGQKVQQISG